MITDKRLQEIKDNVLGTVQIDEAEDIWEIAKELITALEAAQAEVAEANKEICGFRDGLMEQMKLLGDCGQQLAEAQAELAKATCDVLNLQNEASHFNADNTHAHEYIERLKVENAALRAQLAEATEAHELDG